MAATRNCRLVVLSALSQASSFADLLPALCATLARSEVDVLPSISSHYVVGWRSWPSSGSSTGRFVAPSIADAVSAVPAGGISMSVFVASQAGAGAVCNHKLSGGIGINKLAGRIGIQKLAGSKGIHSLAGPCSSTKSKSVMKFTSRGYSGGSPPPPPPNGNGNGNGGMGNNHKLVFLRLLTILKGQVDKLLAEGKLGKDKGATLKISASELGPDDLADTILLLQGISKDLQKDEAFKQLSAAVDKLAENLETKLPKHKILGFLEELLGKGAADLMVAVWSFVAEVFAFVQSKLMIGIGIAACITMEPRVHPYEAVKITFRLFKDTIEGKRKNIKKLQDKAAGKEEEDVDLSKLLLELKQSVEEQGIEMKKIRSDVQKKDAVEWVLIPWLPRSKF